MALNFKHTTIKIKILRFWSLIIIFLCFQVYFNYYLKKISNVNLLI